MAGHDKPPSPTPGAPDEALSRSSSGTQDSKSTSLGSKPLLAGLCTINLLMGIVFALVAPFLPTEALDRGVSQVFVGVIIAAFPVTEIATSPLGAIAVARTGCRFTILLGVGLLGGGVAALGVLQLLHGWLFIAVAVALRMLQGCGSALLVTGTFEAITNGFPENLGTVMGLTETAIAVGSMAGPVLGGFLFEAGGFYLPPVAVGALCIVALPILGCLLPSAKHTAEQDGASSTGDKAPGYVKLLASPVISVMLLLVVLSFGGLTFLEPLLGPHLKATFGLTPSAVGLAFGLASLIYGLGAPASGYAADKGGPFWTLLAGLVLLIGSFVLMGPSVDVIPVTLPLQLVSLGMLGLGCAMTMVPAMPSVMEEGKRLGDVGTGTGGRVSALLSASFSLGEIFGPMLGSALTSAFSFSTACTVYACVLCLGAAVTVLTHVRHPGALSTAIGARRDSDTTPPSPATGTADPEAGHGKGTPTVSDTTHAAAAMASGAPAPATVNTPLLP